ncbi:MAG: hypothetical protein EBQ89_09055 [Alphaproteobacteria bacterium]|nr:hypothetical protein [Alphaproteobacteria bacterium]
MTMTNEPGYYREGEYGIRIENMMLVKAAKDHADAESKLLAFETLTLVPYARNLIDCSLLQADEMVWINAYHARVWEKISPLVDAETREWLKDATQPLSIQDAAKTP